MEDIRSIKERIRLLEAEIVELKERIDRLENDCIPETSHDVFKDEDMPWWADHGQGD